MLQQAGFFCLQCCPTGNAAQKKPQESDPVAATEAEDSSLMIVKDQDYIIEHVERLPYKLMNLLGHGSPSFVERVVDVNSGTVFAHKVVRLANTKDLS